MAAAKNKVGESPLIESWVKQEFSLKQKKESNSKSDKLLHDKYHFEEWILTPGERHGQKHKLKIRVFNKESYNGPRLEDFLKRLDAIYNTAISEIDNNDKLTNKEELKKNLTYYKELTAKKLKEECEIEAIPLQDLVKKEEEVIAKIEQAAEHLQFFIAHALPIVYPKSTLDEAVKLFQHAEAQWTAKQGRPDFINVYQLGQMTRISTQRVVGDKIIPSTKRDEGKLANFVQVSTGSVNSKGESQIDFTGYRHSSYPPIKVKDKIERRAMACEAVKDMLSELARKELEGRDPSEFGINNPLVINLSSMALLSPIKGDKSFMKEESEHRQLKESQYALMMYNQRPLELIINGKKVIVKPQINLMNDPANLHGLKLKQINQSLNKVWHKLGVSSDLDETINTKGMHSFIGDATHHIHDEIEKIKRNKLLDNDKSATEIISLYEKINKAYAESKGLQTAQKKLNQLLEKDELTSAYKDLEEKQKAYLKDKSSANESMYHAQVQKVRKIENKLHKAYKAVEHEREKIWLGNKQNLSELQNQLIAYLGDEKNRQKMESGEGKSLKKFFQFMQLYHQAEALYYSKNDQPHEFPSRYLLVNQLMGKSVDWFCKSGEDRTGRLNNFIEELCGFSAQKGYFPRYDFGKNRILTEDREEQQELAKTVVEFSVSRDICDENAHGARGLQQSESGMKVNAGLPNKSGYAIAKLAKSNLYDVKLLEKVKIESVQKQDTPHLPTKMKDTAKPEPPVVEELDSEKLIAEIMGEQLMTKELQYIKEVNALRAGDIDALNKGTDLLDKKILHKGQQVRERYEKPIHTIQHSVKAIKRINSLLSEGMPIHHGQLVKYLESLEEKTIQAIIQLADHSKDTEKQTALTEATNDIVPVFSRMIKEVKLRLMKDESLQLEAKIKNMSGYSSDEYKALKNQMKVKPDVMPLDQKNYSDINEFLENLIKKTKEPKDKEYIQTIKEGLAKDFERMKKAYETGITAKEAEALCLGANMYTQTLPRLEQLMSNKEDRHEFNQKLPVFLRGIKKAVTGVEQALLEHEIQSYKNYEDMLIQRQVTSLKQTCLQLLNKIGIALDTSHKKDNLTREFSEKIDKARDPDTLNDVKIKLQEQGISHLKSECDALVEKINKYKITDPDPKMSEYCDNLKQKIAQADNLDSLIDLKKSLEKQLKLIDSPLVAEMKKIIQNYREGAKELFSLGKNNKAQRIENALLNVPVELRGKIFSEDPQLIKNKEILAVKAALASHRYLGKRGNIYYKDEEKTDIDDKKAATTFRNLKKQFTEMKMEQNEKEELDKGTRFSSSV